MAINAAGIIFSSLNNSTLSRLTSDRTVAAIPFACRYRLIDFALSNLVNANISNVNIVANYNYRSLLEHLGSGKDWDLARREGGINFISPYQTAHTTNVKLYATHMEALKSMKEYIFEIKEDYVIMMDADCVLNLDVADVIRQHEASAASVTLVTTKYSKERSLKHPRMLMRTENSRIVDASLGSVCTARLPELALNIYVMKTAYLRMLLNLAESDDIASLTYYLIDTYKKENYNTYCYDGFVAYVGSFLDYFRSSIELATSEEARASLLFKKEAPIFTRVHNSAPTIYKEGAKVENSMIADECVIEGTVINSVLARGVHVAKGAVVKNCVLFAKTYVGNNAHLNCIVSDKDVHISDNVNLSGNENLPFYIQKEKRI